MAEGGIEHSVSDTESVFRHSILYSDHSRTSKTQQPLGVSHPQRVQRQEESPYTTVFAVVTFGSLRLKVFIDTKAYSVDNVELVRNGKRWRDTAALQSITTAACTDTDRGCVINGERSETQYLVQSLL
ncbi:hypothetical protein DPMN_040700 [Dreissena polymorpha]|uniref:Uncharacterized protein n=1 Tax=Dreissena polymorpha TaxID=45954 RepID=A0A9D4HX67_DREPO|nr:hypothetical protein DPMN_040700 [Dreissena polymorpha]